MEVDLSSSLVHEIFSLVAKSSPHRLAVHYEGKERSYGDLEADSNRLAHFLREKGIRRGDLVGVMMEKSADLPVALLGIMKSGGAYVPMDPQQPVLRLKEIALQAGIRLVLTQDRLLSQAQKVAEHAPLLDMFVCLDTGIDRSESGRMPSNVPDWHIISPFSPEPPDTLNSPHDLACVLFTSGTTGTPKGVMLHHHGLINCLRSNYRQFGLNENDRYLNVSPYGFDMSMFEIFSPLLSGGQLYILAAPDVQDPWKVALAIEKFRITVWNSVPTTWSLWMNLLGAGFQPELNSLRLAFLGGERLPVEFVKRAAARLPGTLLVNVYGPTETSIWMSCHPIAEPLPPDAERVHVGKPIPNVQVYITDDNMNLCGPGEIGEVCIAGEGVSHGYLHDKERTQASFVKNPFHPDGSLLYRTGDLGTWLPDGNLDIVGRKDLQVKIRGFRIELGEIESQAVGCPGVDQAAVVVQETKDGSKIMHCFLVCDSPETVELARQHLKDRLPSYMIPHRLHRIDTLPRNRNGKTDRKALLNHLNSQERGESMSWNGNDPTLEDLRRTISNIWSTVLEHDEFDDDASFFDVGGDSIKVVKVKMSLDEAYPNMVDVADLFVHSTVRAQSEWLCGKIRGKTQGSSEIGKDRQSEAPSSSATPVRRESSAGQVSEHDIAIIGMACHFPGGSTPEEFWSMLTEGKSQVREIPKERLVEAARFGDKTDLDNVPKGAFLEEIDRFDPVFFKISPKEAELIDPQQRLLLEVIQETIDNAGYGGTKLAGSDTGVFVTASSSDYMQAIARSSAAKEPFALLGNQPNMVANRISYFLNLHGPSMFIDTACSSSLVALHQACQSLIRRECKAALVGGVALHLSPQRFSVVNNLNITSADGHCRPFDKAANGTVAGEGAAAVLLKPLAAALADGDQIHAVIKGTAINHGGHSVVLTAPNPLAQAAVIREALDRSGCAPESISYIEAHGTGTPLGDPIEIQALEQVFGAQSREEPILIGSVKSVIGHLGEAAGIASLMKTIMALKTETLPGQIHFDEPNPELHLERTPFQISGEFIPWKPRAGVRRAGISSFGLGGSNAHIIIEQAPAPLASSNKMERNAHILTLSAWTQGALGQQLTALAQHLSANPSLCLADVCYTANTGRGQYPYRLAAVLHEKEELISLADREAGNPDAPPVCFSGRSQGNEGPGSVLVLGREQAVLRAAVHLYRSSMRFRERFGRILNLPDHTDTVMLLENPSPPYAVRFAAGYALASLWKEWVPSSRIVGLGGGALAARCVNESLEPQEAAMLLWQENEPSEAESAEELTAALFASGLTGGGVIAGLGITAEAAASLEAAPSVWEFAEGTEVVEPSSDSLLNQLAQLFVRGVVIDWEAFDAEFVRRCVGLPTYPFQRQRYWFNSTIMHSRTEVASTLTQTLAPLKAASVPKEQPMSYATMNHAELTLLLTEAIESLLIEPVDFDIDTDFSELDLDSLILVELTSMIREQTGVSVKPHLLFEYPSIRLLADCILQLASEKKSGHEEAEENVR